MVAAPIQIPVFTGESTQPSPDQTTPVDPLAPDADAPFGYMFDPGTGEKRPKKRPGRQPKPPGPAIDKISTGNPPTLEELKAGGRPGGGEDRAPQDKPRPRGKAARAAERARDKAKEEAEPLPPFRAGPIAKWINKRYRRVGKILKVLDPVLGAAIIECTTKDDEDETTVGEAWEEIAKVNPRIRAFLLKAMETGAWSGLFAAHAPILLALLMKENIRKHIPFGKLLGAFLDEPEADGSPSDISTAMGGIRSEDVEQMMGAAMSMMSEFGIGKMGFEVPRNGGAPRQPAEPIVVDSVRMDGGGG